MCVVMRMGMLAMVVMVGCATAPKTVKDQDDLARRAEATLQTMQQHDPALSGMLTHSAGYVVFPSVGKGGVGVGGAFGRGVLYQNGQRAGFVKVEQANVGLVLGGQSFAELLVLRSDYDVAQLKSGNYKLGANVGAVVLEEGASAAATADSGSTAFVMPLGGAMIDVSLDGQRFKYQPNAG